jgi:hypothetical protein
VATLSHPKLSPEWFWEHFRRELSKVCTEAALNSSPGWTRAVIGAAVIVCQQLGNGVIVEREMHGRVDVSARFPGAPQLAVALESELAPVGYMGRKHGKTWREEFVKLCTISAEMRVLSSYFLPRTGRSFEGFLRGQLDHMADAFRNATPSSWLLVFGSENSSQDPDQPWLPFALEPNLCLRALPPAPVPFCPRRIARGLDPRET